jgi:hypothetical protein
MCLRIDGARSCCVDPNSRRRELHCRRDVARRQDSAWVIAPPWMRLRCRKRSLMRRFARRAHPTVVPSGDADPRASARAPRLPCPFGRMVQREPATTGLVAEKSWLPVDPLPLVLQHNDQLSAAIIMRFLDFQPIVLARCERVELPANAFSVLPRESQMRNIPQPGAPYEGQLVTRVACGKVTPAAAKPSAGCKSTSPHGIIADACCRLYS